MHPEISLNCEKSLHAQRFPDSSASTKTGYKILHLGPMGPCLQAVWRLCVSQQIRSDHRVTQTLAVPQPLLWGCVRGGFVWLRLFPAVSCCPAGAKSEYASPEHCKITKLVFKPIPGTPASDLHCTGGTAELCLNPNWDSWFLTHASDEALLLKYYNCSCIKYWQRLYFTFTKSSKMKWLMSQLWSRRSPCTWAMH